MDNQSVLDELLSILEQNGVCLRRDALGGAGSALCKIKGKYTFFIDTQSQIIETARNCAVAVNEILDIDSVYIRPEVRRFIENYIGAH